MKSPACNNRVSKAHFACHSGTKGGKAGRGPAKARTREQAQAAALARWNKTREKQQYDKT
jgi:hypothetical protein